MKILVSLIIKKKIRPRAAKELKEVIYCSSMLSA